MQCDDHAATHGQRWQTLGECVGLVRAFLDRVGGCDERISQEVGS